MKYHELQTSRNKQPKRVGRGISAGQGKTAGRGTKGQNARTGGTRKPGFEGGQNPLMQRLPKLHGFKGGLRPVETVYTGQLDSLTAKTIDAAALSEAGLVSNPYVRVKLIVRGEVSKKHTIKLQAASESAIAAIQKAGGSFEKVDRDPRPATRQKKAD